MFSCVQPRGRHRCSAIPLQPGVGYDVAASKHSLTEVPINMFAGLQEETLYQKARDGELAPATGLATAMPDACCRHPPAKHSSVCRCGRASPQPACVAALNLFLNPPSFVLLPAGTPFVDILAKEGIRPGIKVDTGLQVRELAGSAHVWKSVGSWVCSLEV